MKKQLKQNNKNKKREKGFTILFAVLVSTLVLAVGASIIALSFKQIILSGSARESQFAFYASNTGYECALYWDFNKLGGDLVFATSTESTLAGDLSGVQCAERSVEFIGGGDKTSTSAETKFRIKFDGTDSGQCVLVIVTKEYDDVETRIKTTIDSYGYNTCDSSNPRRIERGLQVNY